MSELLAQLRAISPWEAFAAALGLAYLLLAVRRNLWCWLCAFASTGIYLAIFMRAALYMQAALQIFYLAMAAYGFNEWRRGRTQAGALAIRSWSAGGHAAAALFVFAATALNGWLLVRYTDAAAPYLDSFTTWGSIVTTWMVARRLIENWLYWLVVDGAAAYLYYTQGLLPTTILFVIYLGVVVHGYRVWRREQAAQRAGADVLHEPERVAR